MRLARLHKTLTLSERHTFRLHLGYSVIEGFILGVLALNEFVFIKSLSGSDYELGILFQSSMLVFLLLVFVNEFLKRIRRRRIFLRWTGVITRLPLLLLFFFPRSPEVYQSGALWHVIFLAIFLVYYLAALVINPTINLLLKNNYSHQNFGTLYSYSQSANKVVLLVVTFLYGLLLDADNYAFTYIFPVAGALGMVSVFLLSKIDYSPPEVIHLKTTFGQSVKNSMKNMFLILKNNRPYLHFQIGFMLYGIAFMSTVAVITIFFYNALGLNYSSVAFYKNAFNILAILLLPIFGRIMGRLDPRRFAIITYASLAGYLFALILTEYLPY